MCTAIASSFPVNVVSTRIWSNRQQGQRWAFGVRHVSMFVLLLLLAPRINMAADWSLKFGPAWHLDNRLRVDYNPQAVARDLRPSSYMRTTPGADAAIGSTGEYADHDYLDGFVHTDPGTVDPETDIPGLTWNWGYHSPGQNDGQSISFHANGGATYSEQELPLYADPVRFEDNFSLPGLELGVECALWQRETASAGLVLSMAWYTSRNFAYSARSPVALRIVTSSSSQIVDQYRTEGYTAPSAPYQGTYDLPTTK